MNAADHIAHHEYVGLQIQLVGSKSFYQFDAERAQLVAHGRVNAGVATGNFVASFPCQRRQPPHEGAANAKNVNVHAQILGLHTTGNAQAKCCIMDSLKAEISWLAASLVVEEGLEYGPAKRRAVKQLGLPTRTALPGNDDVEDAVLEHIALFCSETQPGELLALRRLALVWMERMAAFWPHLGGSVWHGTATRLSDIYIQLFCEDSKSAEISLIDHRVNYLVRTIPGLHGELVDALSVHAVCPELGEEVGVHLLIYDRDDVRGALRPDAKGRAPRGDLAALRRLLHDQPS
jgi:hypothetical protein